MKALVKSAPGPGHVGIQEVAEPRCPPDRVKLEVAYCGICGTDLHVLSGAFHSNPPVILGHEFSGVVVETGADVQGIEPGLRAAGMGATAVTCGVCRFCRSGDFIFCSQRKGMGHGVDGAFTRYVLLRPDQVFEIPRGITLEEGAMTEPLAAAARAVLEIAKAKPGETALVSGPGPMGLLCLKLLLAEGVRTFVAGAPGDGERLRAALCCGALAAAPADELRACVLEQTAGQGVDLAFECAGHPDSARTCLDSLRPMGRMTQVAIYGREIPLPMDRIFYKQLTVSGSICYTAQTWRRVMELFAAGRLRLNDLVGIKLPLSEWEQGFHLCQSRQMVKVLLYPEK